MKVSFVTGTLGRGGAEKQLVYMLRALRDEKADLRVLCLTRDEDHEQSVRDLGIDVEWVGSSKYPPVRAAKIIRSLSRNRPDVIQSSHFFTNMYAAAAGRTLRIPSIGAIRSDMTFEFGSNRLFGRQQLKWTDHLIANSQVAMERAIALGIDAASINFLPNVTETNGRPAKLVDEARPVTVLFAGRLGPEKRPELFVKLAAEIREALPHKIIKFEVAGDGPLRPGVEALGRELGLAETHLRFLGNQASMCDVYGRADLLVLTSKHEGTPNVIIEAMAHGIPVVATRVGGVQEVLREDCGIAVDPDDFDGLVTATLQLIKNADLRQHMGRQGYEHVKMNNSLGDLGGKLLKIYQYLLRQ